jgi:putative resolvase
MSVVKLAEWARMQGVHPRTAYRWFGEDRMPVAARRLDSGTIWVDVAETRVVGRVVVYARVSSHRQGQDLDRQVARRYGRRGARNRVMRAVTVTRQQPGPETV